MYCSQKCIYSKPTPSKNFTSHGIMDNPLYDGTTGTHSLTNNNTSAPTHQHTETNEEMEYDVVNRSGAPRPHPPMKPPRSNIYTLDQTYSALEVDNYHLVELGNMNEGEDEGITDTQA